MNLNNIELPDFIVREWYKDNLLPPTASPAITAPDLATPSPPHAPAPPPPQSASAVASALPPPPAATQAPAPPAIPPPPTPATYKFLGNNRRHITLLVHSPGSGFMPDNQLAFLTKILEACRMTLADVAIVNNAAAPVTITALRQQLQPKIVLLFGVEPTAIRMPINFPTFKQLSYDDCTYLSSPALDQLVPDTGDSKLLKSKLWVSLKTLFDV
jgi:hypothetical protein